MSQYPDSGEVDGDAQARQAGAQQLIEEEADVGNAAAHDALHTRRLLLVGLIRRSGQFGRHDLGMVHSCHHVSMTA